jgi:YbbR domain-containing protein
MNRDLKRFFVRNKREKLISIVLALALWLVLVPQDKIVSEKTLTVPLEVRNIPDNLEIVDRPLATVDVTVRAPNRLLNQITPSTLSARLDLEKATLYQQEYPLNKTMISLPPGAEVIDVRPNKVILKLEETKEASLNVHPSIRGRVAPGYRIAKIEFEPRQVVVCGPESKVRARDSVSTAPVDITGLDRSAVFDVDLILPRPELRLVSAQTTVRVSIAIEEDKDEAGEANPRKK